MPKKTKTSKIQIPTKEKEMQRLKKKFTEGINRIRSFHGIHDFEYDLNEGCNKVIDDKIFEECFAKIGEIPETDNNYIQKVQKAKNGLHQRLGCPVAEYIFIPMIKCLSSKYFVSEQKKFEIIYDLIANGIEISGTKKQAIMVGSGFKKNNLLRKWLDTFITKNGGKIDNYSGQKDIIMQLRKALDRNGNGNGHKNNNNNNNRMNNEYYNDMKFEQQPPFFDNQHDNHNIDLLDDNDNDNDQQFMQQELNENYNNYHMQPYQPNQTDFNKHNNYSMNQKTWQQEYLPSMNNNLYNNCNQNNYNNNHHNNHHNNHNNQNNNNETLTQVLNENYVLKNENSKLKKMVNDLTNQIIALKNKNVNHNYYNNQPPQQQQQQQQEQQPFHPIAMPMIDTYLCQSQQTSNSMSMTIYNNNNDDNNHKKRNLVDCEWDNYSNFNQPQRKKQKFSHFNDNMNHIEMYNDVQLDAFDNNLPNNDIDLDMNHNMFDNFENISEFPSEYPYQFQSNCF